MSSTETNSLMPTYTRLNTSFVKGEGCFVFDDTGRAYLDALSGIGVVGLGHSHPKLARVIAEQANTLMHTSNIYRIPSQEELADKLTSVSGMDNCFFGNSGAEANEAAIKIARLFARTKDIDLPHIIVMENAFHGRTLATLSATANRKVQAGFEPLVPGFIRVPYNDIDAVKEVAKNNKQVVAVFLEPVQGEGGIHVAGKTYLEELATLCDELDWLLMLDEVQSGNGRTGEYFAFQHTNIKPDVLTTAKGLGNGIPIGACLSAGKAKSLMQAGQHGTTYGGNPLACKTALEVVSTICEPNFLAQVNEKAKHFESLINEVLIPLEQVDNARVKGLMIGIELNADASSLVQMALEDGLLINVTAGNVVRLLPPLVIETEQIETVVYKLRDLISKL